MSAFVGAGQQVYIRLQRKAAEELALAAGLPAFAPPLPSTTVKVRMEVRCPACGRGRVSSWRMHRRALIAEAECPQRHAFVMEPPLRLSWKDEEEGPGVGATSELCVTLLREVALIACGRREGKTRSCSACAQNAPALLTIAATGARDALAAAICGGSRGACQDCHAKAETIIDTTVETLRAT
ncbi:hypothetical protein ACH4VR_19760 [Streptomyces sp. NPDC020883]|uniref:hypothetical protein n=1 Tax=Streptomyces sp. NPDC020883 TaxID=3365099 RepID=UPI003798F340